MRFSVKFWWPLEIEYWQSFSVIKTFSSDGYMRRQNVQSMSKYHTHSVSQAFGSQEKAMADIMGRASSVNSASSGRKFHVNTLV